MTTATKNPNWWTEEAGFFGREYLRQYDGTILTEEATVRQVDFVERALQTKGALPYDGPIKFLDVPCGHGRHSIELALRTSDYAVTGYELNRHFLEIANAKRKAVEDELWHHEPRWRKNVNFVQGDMRELPFDEEFHVVLNLFTAMGYFGDDREDEKFFTSVYQALKSGGYFLVDYLNRDRIIRNFRPNDWRKLPDGSIVLTEREYEVETGHTHDVRITLKGDTEIHRVASTIRFYAPHELIAMAKRVGFTLWQTYGDFDVERKLTIDSPRAILIFRKPKLLEVSNSK